LKHLRDDDLVLYQDGEIRTAPAERHLYLCRGCRERLQVLELEMRRLSAAPAAAPPLEEGRRPTRGLPAWRRFLQRLGLVRTPP
jgi:hypothetical protein